MSFLQNYGRAIQALAVSNLSKGKSLSSGVSDLSKTLTEFQEKSERNINLARGLTSLLSFCLLDDLS